MGHEYLFVDAASGTNQTWFNRKRCAVPGPIISFPIGGGLGRQPRSTEHRLQAEVWDATFDLTSQDSWRISRSVSYCNQLGIFGYGKLPQSHARVIMNDLRTHIYRFTDCIAGEIKNFRMHRGKKHTSQSHPWNFPLLNSTKIILHRGWKARFPFRKSYNAFKKN